MTTTAGRPRRWRRTAVWVVPVVVAGVVSVAAAITSSGASGAAPNLAPRTPAQLLRAVGLHGSTALSGEISETAALGLPSLPGDQSTASLSWPTFITGTHSIRVWVDGVARQRIALLGELSEADVVHNGRDVWTYTSDTNTATHQVLPASSHQADSGESSPSDAATPGGLANRILTAVAPSTAVTLGATRRVAGHAAYTLVIRPRDARSTVREVTIAIDSTHFVPLQVQVFGASRRPAFQTGFTRVSFGTPPASMFRFHVPAGAAIANNPLTTDRRSDRPAAGTSVATRPRVLGSGWTSVLELHSAAGAGLTLPHELNQLSTPTGRSGARLLHTALVNAVLMPDGRAFVGAVSPATLERVAATTPN